MPPKSKPNAFYGTRNATSAKGAAAAVFGAPHGAPYRSIDNRVHATAPAAFRKAMTADADWLSHYDWDFDWALDGAPLAQPDFTAVDLGDLKTLAKDGAGNARKIEAMTRSICSAGAVPLMFGGDDSTPIPFLNGFAEGPAVTILQIDAHIDWRDEREGERFGFSSTMRRASEMEHVWRIVQAGARGLGSARLQEVNDARNWGARIVPSRRIHREGIDAVLAHIEDGSDCVICLDLDVLDSSVMPAVAAPSPGGLSFLEVTELIAAVADKARIAGFAMVEFVPKHDLTGAMAYTAARIAAHVLAQVARQKSEARR
jgi:agmatinase